MSTAKQQPFVTVTHGISGWFAVIMAKSPEGFYEAWQTGIGRYPDREKAVDEAKAWAQAENLEFVSSTK